MGTDVQPREEKKAKVFRSVSPKAETQKRDGSKGVKPFDSLQQIIGNRAVQRLIAQGSGSGPAELDDEIAGRINRARSGGQNIDESARLQMEQATNVDLSAVRVHTGAESNILNEQLGAKAFTTGQDIFFRSGAYDPGSSGGQELLAHELTHVVQQGSGRVRSSGKRMTVNAPGDIFEQEAEAVAKNMPVPGAAVEVLRQVEEEEIQMQEEEEELQMHEKEEEEVQLQEMEEDEELAR
jgi:hypothetical protein